MAEAIWVRDAELQMGEWRGCGRNMHQLRVLEEKIVVLDGH